MRKILNLFRNHFSFAQYTFLIVYILCLVWLAKSLVSGAFDSYVLLNHSSKAEAFLVRPDVKAQAGEWGEISLGHYRFSADGREYDVYLRWASGASEIITYYKNDPSINNQYGTHTADSMFDWVTRKFFLSIIFFIIALAPLVITLHKWIEEVENDARRSKSP